MNDDKAIKPQDLGRSQAHQAELQAQDHNALQAGDFFATDVGLAGTLFNAQLTFITNRVLPSGAGAARPIAVAMLPWSLAKVVYLQLGNLLAEFERTQGEIALPKEWQSKFDAGAFRPRFTNAPPEAKGRE